MKHYGEPGFLIQAPYDEFFADQLKGMVPIRERWFNWPRKGWWIAEKHRDLVLHLVREAFGAIVVVDEDGREVTHEGDERLEQGRLL